MHALYTGNTLFVPSKAKKFFHVGVMIAMSLTQGGSGFQFISEAMYDYLCGKEITSINVTIDDVGNSEIRNLINKEPDRKGNRII